jgi:outer membrane protein assembly factor BamB
MSLHKLIVAIIIVLSSYPTLQAENWSSWRGPSGNGATSEKGFPTTWSTTENVAWRIDLPAPGNSTPITWQDNVLLTQATAEGTKRHLTCYDLKSGKQRWQYTAAIEQVEKTHKTNPHAAGSPVTDGKHVVVSFGSAGIHCVDMKGNLKWQANMGRLEHIWGTSASPVIFEHLVIVNCGPGIRAFWIALDIETGEEVWKTESKNFVSTKPEEFRGSWSTPFVYGSGADAVMFISMPLKFYALKPRTGDILWTCDGPGMLAYTSPLVNRDIAVTMSGYGGPSLAIKRGGQGDVTASHRLWHKTERVENPQRIGSGLIIGEYIYIVNEPGIAWCMDLKTGERLWQQRLGDSKCWSSLCLVEGKIFVVNDKGTTFVIDPNPKQCNIIHENKLAELTRGSLAFANGRILIRTYKSLYCIQSK